MTKKLGIEQTDIFALFNIEDEVQIKKQEVEEKKKQEEEQKRKLEEERKKKDAAIQEKIDRFKERNKETNEEENKETQVNKVQSPTEKKTAAKPIADALEVNIETKINFYGNEFAVLDYFTVEEIEKGLPRKRKGEEIYEPINEEDVRKRLEKEYPEFCAGLCKIVYKKKQNMIAPVLTAGRKGLKTAEKMESSSSDEDLSCNPKKIPYSIIQDFISISKYFSENFSTEVHGDIYLDNESHEFFLDIPDQEANMFWVEVTEDEEDKLERFNFNMPKKIAEIHSHHVMSPKPSEQDDRSEIAGNTLYIIVGRINRYFPDITARIYDQNESIHKPINIHSILEDPFKNIPQKYELGVVEIK